MYFNTYNILVRDIELKGQSLEEAKEDDEKVDVRCFALFMATQLMSSTSKYSTETKSNYANTAWPSMKEERSHSSQLSPIASPRSKLTRVNHSLGSSEFQYIHTFVKANLGLLLRLVSSEIHMVDNIGLSN